MTENPVMILLYLGIAAYVGHIYWTDYKSGRAEDPEAGAMPGATGTTLSAILIAVAGALVILGIETGGEIALGVAAEQSEMVWYFVFAIVAAGIVEEVIFRGYLVIDKRGAALLAASCVGFSLLFALIHFHLFSFEYPDEVPRWQFWAAEVEWTLTSKGWFTTVILFANSLWFYLCRFGPWNKTRSIFPCMIAHAASNFGVFVVKLVQGFVIF
jgi:membrane protease YdiL (CAAX protease family)